MQVQEWEKNERTERIALSAMFVAVMLESGDILKVLSR